MSHFGVLVIGNNVEEQMAPYHEYECTGADDQYVVDVDKTKEVLDEMDDNRENYDSLEDYIKQYWGFEVVSDEECVTSKWGYAVVKDGAVTKAIRRTNPNAKWDWWVVGGRWSDFWTLKDGTKADSAKKKDIDFEGMMDIAGVKAGMQWDAVHPYLNQEDIKSFVSWKSFMKRVENKEITIEDARDGFHNQPAMVSFSKAREDEKVSVFANIEDFVQPREEHVRAVRESAITVFAIVRDGEWYERGQMGWWACVTDEKDGYDWCSEFHSVLEGLPEDTVLTIVDCHI